MPGGLADAPWRESAALVEALALQRTKEPAQQSWRPQHSPQPTVDGGSIRLDNGPSERILVVLPSVPCSSEEGVNMVDPNGGSLIPVAVWYDYI